MTEYLLHIPKVSDRSLFNCMSGLASSFSGQSVVSNVYVIGDINFSNVQLDAEQLPEELKTVLECNSKLIQTFSLNISQFIITYSRGGFDAKKKSPVYDEIKINSNNTQLDHQHRITIITTMSRELKAFDPSSEPSGILSEEQQKQLDIHLSAIKELENLNSELSKKITTDLYESNQQLQKEFRERQDKLSQQIVEERSKLTEEFNDREDKLREKIAGLERREQEIDIRDNTIVRRELRNSFLDVIKERTSKFQLTSETRKLRIPIHILCFLVIAATAYASFNYAKEFLSLLSVNQPIDLYILWQLGIKQIAFTAISGSTLIFYLKWLNRWFEKHAQAEFHLKQLQLDFERANWVVETALEWKKELKDAVIPADLLSSLTCNLFSTTEDENQPLHPTDQITNTLLGQAAKVKVKAGDADLEFTGKGIKKAEKNLKR